MRIPDLRRRQVYEREQLFCLRCGRYVGSGVPLSIHHRYPRRMGGTSNPEINDIRNLVLLCGLGNEDTNYCHGWIEQHRLAAGEQGWLLRSLDDVDMPVMNVYGQLVRLLPNGHKVYVQ